MEELINKIYMLTGYTIAELIQEFEMDFPLIIELNFKSIYKDNDNNKIIIKVIDKISECPIELFFNENTFKLEML